ncbi:exodeoxyribonuclease VII large subunit [Nannocystis pusilla]|uniref:exodeoxyribonuclease VII large subunit n=1 Tax=Nannocystis pusilla TaxID=889268 RepID=UPI003B7ED6A6
MRHRLADGQLFRVYGRLGIYAAQGKFQLYAERAEPAGLGARMQQLEQLKAKLAAEGLFARERKRPVPAWPRIVGVVTSASGAAIHDILKVARRRCPVRILLSPAQVQGEDAAFSLVRAAAAAAAAGRRRDHCRPRRRAQEDLWAFNDEGLARAVAACPVPVVSAVGHEVDITICDFVADLRAATPSHAAELVVPDREGYLSRLHHVERRLVLATKRRVLDERARLELLTRRLAAAGHRLVLAPRRRLDALLARLGNQHPRARLARDRRLLAALHARLLAQHPRHRLDRARRRLLAAELALRERARVLAQPARLRLARAAAALNALSPLAVLQRGFAVVSTDAVVVTDVAQVAAGDAVRVELARGAFAAQVTAVEPVKVPS